MISDINNLAIRNLGVVDYQLAHQKMQNFTDKRSENTQDEVWLLEHNPVFTLGRKGNRDNFLVDHDIMVVQSDRGGDVTYHGPGQLVIYCMFNLKRLNIGVKSLVTGLEESFITFLSESNIVGQRLDNAPGVYVENRKIASLGLRVRNGCSFHGMSINVDMDMNPFGYIHPCGLKNMKVTQLSELGIHQTCEQVASVMTDKIIQQFYQ